MCIRDRDADDGAADGSVAGAAAVRDGAAVVVRRRGRGAGPVSYTHLRAHETVLDLVCRLLLEKKKNLHSQSSASHTT